MGNPLDFNGRPSGRRRRIVVISTVMAKQQRPLTQKQETFVRKVAEGMAASRAYREAGYTATAHAAEVMASKTLRNAEVAARLAELRAEQAKRHEVTIDTLPGSSMRTGPTRSASIRWRRRFRPRR